MLVERSMGFALRWANVWIPALSSLLLGSLWMAVPAAVAEGSGALLRRSWTLTRGHRLAVGMILLLVHAVDRASLELLALAWKGPPWLGHVIWWAQDLLVVLLSAVLAAVTYHALRLEKESVDVSDLADVFV